MAQYTLRKPTFDIPSAADFRKEWPHIADDGLQKIVSYEMQSFQFHRELIARLHTRRYDDYRKKYQIQPLDFTLRAGLAKSVVSSGVAILEAVLRDYGIQKSYIPNNPAKRLTFGKILNKWLDSGDIEKAPVPKPYIATHFPALKSIWESRNDIHLHKSVSTPKKFYEDVIPRTEAEIEALLAIMEFLKKNKP